jgi:PAS domain-containing protein
MIRKDGEKRVVRIASEKIMAENKLVGIKSVFHDITEKKAAEEVLKKRINELEKFYEMSLPDYSKK